MSSLPLPKEAYIKMDEDIRRAPRASSYFIVMGCNSKGQPVPLLLAYGKGQVPICLIELNEPNEVQQLIDGLQSLLADIDVTNSTEVQ